MSGTADFNDPINLQVMWNSLIFIADQADSVLGRTAFSPIVRENHDYVTVLLDSRGRALAQCTWSIPVFITSLPVAAQTYFLPKFPADTLVEGDVLATNDPAKGMGTANRGRYSNPKLDELLQEALGSIEPALEAHVAKHSAFALRLGLGEFADELLFSKRVQAARLQETGFEFAYPSLGPALEQLLG